MMNKIYNEPEFKVVITKSEDILTASGGGSTLNQAPSGWEQLGGGTTPFVEL